MGLRQALSFEDSLQELNQSFKYTSFFTAVMTALVIIGVVFLSLILAGRLTKPIEYLTDLAEQAARGNYKVRARVKTHGEVQVLANTLNSMLGEIETYSEHLEELVKSRTEALRQSHEDLAKANGIMKRELSVARTIQEAIIPRRFPVFGSVWVNGNYLPMEELGGDFYDVFQIDNNRIVLLIADVSGHGVPAALVTAHQPLLGEIDFHVVFNEDRAFQGTNGSERPATAATPLVANGRDDDAGGGEELLLHQQAVDARHADVEETLDLVPHELGRDRRLLGHGHVRGPRGDDQDRPLSRHLRLLRPDHRDPRLGVEHRVLELPLDRRSLRLVEARDQDVGSRLAHRPRHRDESSDPHLLLPARISLRTGRALGGRRDLPAKVPQAVARLPRGPELPRLHVGREEHEPG